MSEVSLNIGKRIFRLVCIDGQEGELKQAAGILDEYASRILSENTEVSEAQLLLMSGLMVADRSIATERENKNLQAYQRDLESRLTKVEEVAQSKTSENTDDLKASLSAANSEIKALKAKMERELSASQADLKEAQSRAEKMHSENEELKADISQIKADHLQAVENLQSQLDELVKTNVLLNAQIEKITIGLPDIAESPQVENAHSNHEQAQKSESNGDTMTQLLQGLERLANG